MAQSVPAQFFGGVYVVGKYCCCKPCASSFSPSFLFQKNAVCFRRFAIFPQPFTLLDQCVRHADESRFFSLVNFNCFMKFSLRLIK